MFSLSFPTLLNRGRFDWVARDRELVSHGIRQRHAPKSSEDRAGAATARPTQRARSSRPPAATAAGLRHTAVRHPTLQPVGELYRDVDVEGGAEREEDVPDPARQLREHQPGGYMYMWWWLHVVVTRGGYTRCYTWWLHVVVTRGGYTWWFRTCESISPVVRKKTVGNQLRIQFRPSIGTRVPVGAPPSSRRSRVNVQLEAPSPPSVVSRASCSLYLCDEVPAVVSQPRQDHM